MPEVTSVTQTVQIGRETTAGTVIAANRLLRSMSIEPEEKAKLEVFRPYGMKYPALTAMGKEWTEASIKGIPCYTEIIYPLSSILCHPTPAQIAATAAYTWLYQPSTTAEDTIDSFTVEQGSSVRAHRFAFGVVDEFALKVTREKVEVDGHMIGTILTDAITMTATPTALALVPMLPSQFDVFVDPTAAGLGTTRMTRVLSCELSIKNRFAPMWVINSQNPSWVLPVELAPEAQIKLKLEADATGMAFLTSMRAGTTHFVRLQSTGAVIEGANSYRFRWDCAGQVSEPSKWEDEDGVYAIEWTFNVVHDATWTRAMQAEVITSNITF
jgi:hypothetical protein